MAIVCLWILNDRDSPNGNDKIRVGFYCQSLTLSEFMARFKILCDIVMAESIVAPKLDFFNWHKNKFPSPDRIGHRSHYKKKKVGEGRMKEAIVIKKYDTSIFYTVRTYSSSDTLL